MTTEPNTESPNPSGPQPIIPAPQELRAKMERLSKAPPVTFEKAKAQTDAAKLDPEKAFAHLLELGNRIDMTDAVALEEAQAKIVDLERKVQIRDAQTLRLEATVAEMRAVIEGYHAFAPTDGPDDSDEANAAKQIAAAYELTRTALALLAPYCPPEGKA